MSAGQVDGVEELVRQLRAKRDESATLHREKKELLARLREVSQRLDTLLMEGEIANLEREIILALTSADPT